MPPKLVGKALFKVCMGPLGSECECREGLWSKSVIFLGPGCGSEINFCVYLLLRMNELNAHRTYNMCSINISHSYYYSFD